MPNLPTHLSMALRTASVMAHPTINEHLGSFLLGSTSPDIRSMTKWKRDQTHFAPLTINRVGTGVEGLFRTHPKLADSSKVNYATRVFLAGYFSHMVADETWILEIYLPCFDNHHYSNQVQGNIWDRALQLDMDRAAGEEPAYMEQVHTALERSESGVEVGFISPETLSQWRERVIDFTSRDFSWERLRFMARRMYGDDPTAVDMVDEFIQDMPGSLERVYRDIPLERIEAFRDKAIGESVRLIKEYMSVPESN